MFYTSLPIIILLYANHIFDVLCKATWAIGNKKHYLDLFYMNAEAGNLEELMTAYCKKFSLQRDLQWLGVSLQN